MSRQIPAFSGLQDVSYITLAGVGYSAFSSGFLSDDMMNPTDLEIVLASKDNLTEGQLKNINANKAISRLFVSQLDGSYNPDPALFERKPINRDLRQSMGKTLNSFDCQIYDLRIPGSHCERKISSH